MGYIFVVASVNAILCESSKGMNIMELKRTETCLIYQHWLLPTFDNFKTCSNPKGKKSGESRHKPSEFPDVDFLPPLTPPLLLEKI